jgi:glycerol kinase
MEVIAALDQGTTSTRCIFFNKNGQIISSAQKEHKQIYPKPGWVEHDPLEILNNSKEVILQALKKSGIAQNNINSIGITNQRETTILWNKITGIPYGNAIVWQDTRTDKICKDLSKSDNSELFKSITGLPITTYFSGPKIKWMIENSPSVQKDILRNEVFFGTIDTWLIWNLTGGIDGGKHLTDVTNASRTMLMDLKTLSWDTKLQNVLGIPSDILPDIRPSSGFFGYTTDIIASTPICGNLGDQQAALFGQVCFQPGDAKNTYGTGCFMLLNTGSKIIHSKHGLLSTVGYQIGDHEPVYCLEGSIAITGALVQWLRDNLGIIQKSSEIEALAKSVKDNGGVFLVPAFSGLFAPYWQSNARGLIIGLTRFANKGHIARAALEATAFQTLDVLEAMKKDSKIDLNILKVDGGMVKNEFLMQFQADILNKSVVRPIVTETTALGVAYAAGLSTGFWRSQEELADNWKEGKTWSPNIKNPHRDKLLHYWKKATRKSFDWIED